MSHTTTDTPQQLSLPSAAEDYNREWLCRAFLPYLASGQSVQLPDFLRLLSLATPRLASLPNCVPMDSESAPCLVIGPLRGHCDVAKHLAVSLARHPLACVVFLGDYIDGGTRSIDALSVALATCISLAAGRVAVLRGRREALFPAPRRWSGGNGDDESRLDTALRWRCVQYVASGALLRKPHEGGSEDEVAAQLMREVESVLRGAIQAMPVAATVHRKFFCVGGGISGGARTIDAINALDREVAEPDANSAVLWDLTCSDPCDEDDEALAAREGFDFARNQETSMGCVYSYNAACDFLRRNELLGIIRGTSMPLFASPPLVSSAGRPSTGRYSSYDAGFRCYRATPLALPSTVSIFSAPRLGGRAHNLGAVAWIKQGAMSLHQFDADVRRPVQLPGDATGSAFDWSLPLMQHYLGQALRAMLMPVAGPADLVLDDAPDDACLQDRSLIQLPLVDPHAKVSATGCDAALAPPALGAASDVAGRVRRFRRLCQHASKLPKGLDALSGLRRHGTPSPPPAATSLEA